MPNNANGRPGAWEDVVDAAYAACLMAREAGDGFDLEALLAGLRPDVAAEVREALGDEQSTLHLAFGSPTAAAEAWSSVEAQPSDDRPKPPAEPVISLPGYRVVEEIGRGGMAVVFRAVQEGTRRDVAVKFMQPDMLAPELAERFHQETAVLGRLNHENIVRVFGAGMAGRRPYFVMELLDRASLKDRSDQYSPARTPGGSRVRDQFRDRQRACAGLVEVVARALQHAHEAGFVHRDIKPSNILFSQDGVPKVSDFGLARSTRDGDDPLTATGQVLGTAFYMSPEQASGQSSQAGAAADVFSLGVVFYELLTGRRPFPGPDDLEARRQIVTVEPAAPRSVLPPLDRDLETICLKCLEKNPRDRYPDAGALAADLGRWRVGQPVKARPVGRPGRAWRWARRDPGRAALWAAAVLLPLTLGVGYTVALRKQLDRAVSAEAKADSEAGRAKAAEKLANEQRREAEAKTAWMTFEKAEQTRKHGHPAGAGGLVDQIPGEFLGWEAHRLKHETSRSPYTGRVMAGHDWGVLDLALSPDGRRAVSAGADGQVLVWDVASGTIARRLADGLKIKQLNGFHGHFYHDRRDAPDGRPRADYAVSVAWIGRGTEVAAATFSGRGRVYDAETGATRDVVAAGSPLYAAAARDDGAAVVFGSEGGMLHLRGLAPKARADRDARLPDAAITAIAWCGRRGGWLVGDAAGKVVELDAATLEVRRRFEVPAPVWSLDVFEGDRAKAPKLAIGCGSPKLRLVDMTDAWVVETREIPMGTAAPKAAHAVRFGADGRGLYAADDLGRLHSWEEPLGNYRWAAAWVPRGAVTSALFEKADDGPDGLPLPFRRVGAAIRPAPDGRALLTAGMDKAVRVWENLHDEGITRLEFGPSPRIAFDPNPDRAGLLWGLDADGRLQVVDTRSAPPRVVASVQAHAGGGSDLALDRTGGQVITAGKDRHVRFWALRGDRLVSSGPEIVHERPLMGVARSRGRPWVAAVDEAGDILVWDVERGERIFLDATWDSKERPLTGRIAFNCDGSRLAAFGSAATCFVYETKGGSFRRISTNPGKGLAGARGGMALRWSPVDPDFLLMADDYGRNVPVYLGPVGDPRGRHEGGPPETIVRAMEATADGNRWFVLEQGGRLVVRDPKRFGDILVRQTHGGEGFDLALDRDGRRLAASFATGRVEIWETQEASPDSSIPEDDRSCPSQHVAIPGLTLHYDAKMRAVDGRGRLHLLAFEQAASADSTRAPENQLIYLRVDRDEVVREVIPCASWTRDDAVQLRLDRRGEEPIVTFRLARPSLGPYAGTLHLARRVGRASWALEQVAVASNWGFHPEPVLNAEADDVDQVFHFAHGGVFLGRSFRESDGWNVERVGTPGDGFQLAGVDRSGGRAYFVFKRKAFDADPTPPVFARWEGGELIKEIVDPAAHRAALAIDATGEPVLVLARRASTTSYTLAVARRRNEAWTLEPIPGVVLDGPVEQSVCDASGRLAFAHGQPDGSTVLYRETPAGWRSARLPRRDGDPVMARFVLASTPAELVLAIVRGTGTAQTLEVLKPGRIDEPGRAR